MVCTLQHWWVFMLLCLRYDITCCGCVESECTSLLNSVYNVCHNKAVTIWQCAYKSSRMGALYAHNTFTLNTKLHTWITITTSIKGIGIKGKSRSGTLKIIKIQLCQVKLNWTWQWTRVTSMRLTSSTKNDS